MSQNTPAELELMRMKAAERFNEITAPPAKAPMTREEVAEAMPTEGEGE